MLYDIVDSLNTTREIYLNGGDYRGEHYEPNDKNIWWQLIQLLPSSYNQIRNVMCNYETLANIYKSRKNHKLDEWQDFCKFIEQLPYSELICNPKFTTDEQIKDNPKELIKCTRCGGGGYLQIAPGVRGVKKCPECNGTGKIGQVK